MHKSFPLCNLLLYQAPPALAESQMKHLLPAFFTCSFAQHVKHKYWSKVPGLRRYRPIFWRSEQISATHVRCGPSPFSTSSCLASGALSRAVSWERLGWLSQTPSSPHRLNSGLSSPAGCVFSSSSPKNPIATYIFHRKRVKNRAKKTREQDRIERKEESDFASDIKSPSCV